MPSSPRSSASPMRCCCWRRAIRRWAPIASSPSGTAAASSIPRRSARGAARRVRGPRARMIADRSSAGWRAPFCEPLGVPQERTIRLDASLPPDVACRRYDAAVDCGRRLRPRGARPRAQRPPRLQRAADRARRAHAPRAADAREHAQQRPLLGRGGQRTARGADMRPGRDARRRARSCSSSPARTSARSCARRWHRCPRPTCPPRGCSRRPATSSCSPTGTRSAYSLIAPGKHAADEVALQHEVDDHDRQRPRARRPRRPWSDRRRASRRRRTRGRAERSCCPSPPAARARAGTRSRCR